MKKSTYLLLAVILILLGLIFFKLSKVDPVTGFEKKHSDAVTELLKKPEGGIIGFPNKKMDDSIEFVAYHYNKYKDECIIKKGTDQCVDYMMVFDSYIKDNKRFESFYSYFYEERFGKFDKLNELQRYTVITSFCMEKENKCYYYLEEEYYSLVSTPSDIYNNYTSSRKVDAVILDFYYRKKHTSF